MVQLQSSRSSPKKDRFSSSSPAPITSLVISTPPNQKLANPLRKVAFALKKRTRRSLTLLAVVILAVIAIAVVPSSVQSDSDNEFIQDQLGIIHSKMDAVKQSNQGVGETLPSTVQIDEYRTALLDSIAACEAIKARVDKMDAKSKEKYKDPIVHINNFCKDMTEVNDYANRVASATKQFVAFPAHNLASADNAQAKTDFTEIVGYTVTDLEKLKSNPVQDPALSEMIIGLENLKAVTLDTATVAPALAQAATSQQRNIVNARVYYWSNTIKIDLLQGAIDRLKNEFNN